MARKGKTKLHQSLEYVLLLKKKKVNTKHSANVYVVVRVHHFYFFEKSKRTNKCLFIYPDTEFKMTG